MKQSRKAMRLNKFHSYERYFLAVLLTGLISCNQKPSITPGTFQHRQIDGDDTIIRQYEFYPNGAFERRLYAYYKDSSHETNLLGIRSGKWKNENSTVLEIEIDKQLRFDENSDSGKSKIFSPPEFKNLKYRAVKGGSLEIFHEADQYGPSKWELWQKLE